MNHPTMLRRHFRIAFLAACAGLVYLASRTTAGEDATASKKQTSLDPKRESVFLAVTKHYRQWGRLDDELRWAPYLCRTPLAATPHFSKTDDASTHGRKLYSLFAADRAAYLAACHANPAKPAPVKILPEMPELRGAKQVLVKESWAIKEITEQQRAELAARETKNQSPGATEDHFSRFVTKGGKIYHADEKEGLFVMVQFESQKDTDDGWIYGTVSADGKQVTSSGLVQSCMDCHQHAPHGRIFGAADSP